MATNLFSLSLITLTYFHSHSWQQGLFLPPCLFLLPISLAATVSGPLLWSLLYNNTKPTHSYHQPYQIQWTFGDEDLIPMVTHKYIVCMCTRHRHTYMHTDLGNSTTGTRWVLSGHLVKAMTWFMSVVRPKSVIGQMLGHTDKHQEAALQHCKENKKIIVSLSSEKALRRWRPQPT